MGRVADPDEVGAPNPSLPIFDHPPKADERGMGETFPHAFGVTVPTIFVGTP